MAQLGAYRDTPLLILWMHHALTLACKRQSGTLTLYLAERRALEQF